MAKKREERVVMDDVVDGIDGVKSIVNKELKRMLRKVVKHKRSKHSKTAQSIHKEYKISKRTLFYIKEYSAKSNVPLKIIKESWKVLVFTALLSSLGGLKLTYIRENIVTVLPLLIVMPALMNMVGSFGTITSSKFTNMLFFRMVTKRWWKSRALQKLFVVLFVAAIATSLFIGLMSNVLAHWLGFSASKYIALKVMMITVVTAVSLFGIIFSVSVIVGLHLYRKKADPNNFLIPLTTAIADLGSLLIFSTLVAVMF
jgi:cation transporter-like permease